MSIHQIKDYISYWFQIWLEYFFLHWIKCNLRFKTMSHKKAHNIVCRIFCMHVTVFIQCSCKCDHYMILYAILVKRIPCGGLFEPYWMRWITVMWLVLFSHWTGSVSVFLSLFDSAWDTLYLFLYSFEIQPLNPVYQSKRESENHCFGVEPGSLFYYIHCKEKLEKLARIFGRIKL